MNSIRKTYLYIITTISLSVFSLLALYFVTPMPNQDENGFTREWNNDILIPLHNSETTLPYTDIIGLSDSTIYLSLPNPQWLALLYPSLEIKDTVSFAVNAKNEKLTRIFSLTIDSPHITLFASNVPAIVSGIFLGNSIGNISVNQISTLFTRSAYISPEKIVLRVIDSLSQQQVFRIVDRYKGFVLAENKIIEDTDNVGFSNDGILKYDDSTARIIYIQSFQNSFYCMDTSLNLLYTSHTIDTVKTNKVKIEKLLLDKKETLMPTNPRIVVNKDAQADNGILYVQSRLRADNESLSIFNENTVIDMYSLKDGKYMSSFYIPSDSHKRSLKSFYIRNGMLVVLTETHISTFKLKFE